jgi:hypothetical protein
MAPAAPPIPGLQYQLQSYAGKVRALGVCWFIYAGFSLLMGFAGLAFAHSMFSGGGPWAHGPWMHGPFPPNIFGPAWLHFAGLILIVRTALTLIAAWGLMQQEQWGRILAIIVAFLSLIHFPFGTALGIWTLIVLLGYRNFSLYAQL